MVRRIQLVVQTILNDFTESTEAILEQLFTNLTHLRFSPKFQRLTPINFLSIGLNRGQGLILGEIQKIRQNWVKKVV